MITGVASYSRFSSNMQDGSSIDQQQRRCHEKAAQNEHSITAGLEFADAAISGTKKDRAGLNAMLAAARSGKFQVLYVDSLSRLARELVITLPMLKELVHVFGIRVISVSEGLDSNQAGWELNAIFRSWMHQELIAVIRAAVLRGQEDAVLADRSVGDWPFGYGSEPISGSDSGRRGRNKKPRMRYTINEDHAAWVRRIFDWFVNERRPINWIVRELNRLNAPKDRRSRTPGWHHSYITLLLENEKYIGIWPWGRTTRVKNPLTGQVRQERRDPAEAAKWLRERPHLQIVDTDLFFRAQGLLDEFEAKYELHRRPNGQFHGAPKGGARPRHLLQGLLKCACGSNFGRLGGSKFVYIGCRAAHRGLCKMRTRVPRDLATQRILQAVSRRIKGDPAWRDAILEETRLAWAKSEQSVPEQKAQLERTVEATKTKIQHLLDMVEDGEPYPDTRDRLSTRRRELAQSERELTAMANKVGSIDGPPTEEWVDEKIRDLNELLHQATPAANYALQQLIGEVDVREIDLPGRKHKGLVAGFSLSARATARALGSADSTPIPDGDGGPRIEIVLSRMPPWAEHADRVKEMFEAERRDDQIAQDLGIPYNWVPKARRWWYQFRGLEVPSAVRPHLCRKPVKKAERLSESAKALWDKHLEMGEIGERLSINRSMARDAVQFWFRSRGLPYVDGRSRSRRATRKKAAELNVQDPNGDGPVAPADPRMKPNDSAASRVAENGGAAS